MKRDTPQGLGLKREPWNDHWIDQNEHPGWEAWRTPEDVVLGLPRGCQRVSMEPLAGVRGTTMVCTEPEGVFSVWRNFKGKAAGLPKAPPSAGKAVQT